MMTSAAADLATIGSNVSAAHMAAAAPTVAVLPAAADEVSASIAHLFSQHAANYQAMAGQAAAFNDQFVQTLKSGGAAYAQTETTSAALLRPLNASAASQSLVISTVLFLESLPVVGQLFEGLFALLGISLLLLLFGSLYFVGQLVHLVAQFGL